MEIGVYFPILYLSLFSDINHNLRNFKVIWENSYLQRKINASNNGMSKQRNQLLMTLMPN